MKIKLLLRFWLAGWLMYASFPSMAQSQKAKDCGESCFATQVQNITETADGCRRYTLLITNNGGCGHALSHYTVAVPCGDVSNVSNSEGWKQEINVTDPTTGLFGFKIDEISGFGENGNPGSFTVEFTVCSQNDCSQNPDCWAPQVAYKAGQCVFLEQTEVSCSKLSAHLDLAHATCFGENDGKATVVIEEGEAPFTYAWSNSGTGSGISGLVAGDYTVVITDASGETLELSGVITQPEAIEVTREITTASCSGTNDGAVNITVTGGQAPYTYSWSNGATTEDLSGLAPGYYRLTVTDSKQCSAEISAVVGSAVSINITGQVQKTSCSAATGAVDISVTGGSAPYTYSWSNGATTEDLSSLSTGIYTVSVTDANGCSSRRSFFVSENNPLQLNATTSKTACVENNSGTIDLTVTGGAEPLTFEWSNGPTTEDINGLSQGVYTVEVTDANGCSANLSVSVVSESIQVTSDTKSPACNGETNGYINVTPVTGEAPYTYLWSTGSTAQNLTNIGGGLYSVTVTDAAGCSTKLNFFLANPLPLTISGTVANPNCVAGEFDIDLSVTGGTAPYIYSWSDGTVTADLGSLPAGSYTVVVTDARGCTASAVFTADAAASDCTDISNPDNQDSPDDTDDTDNTDDGTGDDTDSTDGDGSTGDGSTGDGSDGSGDDGSTGDDNPDDGNTTDPGDGTGDGSDTPDDGDGSDDGTGDNDGDVDQNCENPFETNIELVSVDGNCYTYKATIDYNGYHSYGLSHLSVAVPCGTLGDVSNSEGWKLEVGTDATTGISGFKIDEINGFGEGNWPEEFEVAFTVCATDESCADKLSDWNYTVAYKYGQCVSYETVNVTTPGPSAQLLAYPNPFTAYTTIEFSNLPEGYTTVDVYNQRGERVKQLFAGVTREGVKYSFTLDGRDLPNDTYTYRVSTPSGVYQGKIMLIR